MRILYSLVILLTSVVFASQGQTREDYDMQTGRIDNRSVHIFPNPAVDFVHIRLDQVPARHLKLSVHNIIGNEIPVETEIIDEYEVRVKVKDLNSGYYLLAVKDEQDHFRGTFKFVKR